MCAWDHFKNERASPRDAERISLTSNCQNYAQDLILNQTLARGKDEEAIVLCLWLERRASFP